MCFQGLYTYFKERNYIHSRVWRVAMINGYFGDERRTTSREL